MAENKSLSATIQELLYQIRIPLVFVALMWAGHLFNFLTFGSMRSFGIYPRTFSGLIGIITAPFVHGDLQHLMSNTFPILFLMTMLFLLYKKIASQVFISLYIATGFFVWLFARSSYHIGASGIVYALVSFLFWTGVFRRNIRSIAISLAVLFLYSSYFLGILPDEPGISWESHLIGGIMGIVVAYLFRHALEDEEVYVKEAYPEELRQPYFDRDTFLYTKEERRAKDQDDDNDWFTTSSY